MVSCMRLRRDQEQGYHHLASLSSFLQKYYDLYAEDKKRYDKAMEEYVKKQKLSVDATGGEGNASKDTGSSQLPAN